MPRNLNILLSLVMVFIATLACATQAPAPTATPPSATDTPTTETPAPTPTATSTPSSTPTEVIIPASALAGLLYRASDPATGESILWQFDGEGNPQPLLEAQNALFSPDYSYAAYSDDGVWLVDFASKTLKKLENLEQKYVLALGWFSPTELVVWTEYEGVLNVSVLDEKSDEIAYLFYGLSCVGISPAGKVAVYLPGDGPIAGQVEVYPDDLPSNESISTVLDELGYIPCPSWSHSGNAMAWLTSHYEEGNYINGLGVIDLDAKTGIVFHETPNTFVSYTEYVGLGQNPGRNDYLTWDSENLRVGFATQEIDLSFWVATIDGQSEYQLPNWPIWNPTQPWLAYWDFAHDPAKPELWIMESNGENAQMVGTRKGGNATEAYLSTLWSPDGELLLYQDVDGTMWLTDFDTQKAQKVDIDFQGEFVTWIPPLNITLSELVALPTPIPFSCPNAPSPRLQVGQTARVTINGSGGTRLRSSPDVLPDNILASLVEGQGFEIIGGPMCSERPGRTDAYVYWEISISERNLTGWVAEGDFEEYYIEPWP